MSRNGHVALKKRLQTLEGGSAPAGARRHLSLILRSLPETPACLLVLLVAKDLLNEGGTQRF